MSPTRSATAIAHPNIALAKYWGKRPTEGNVPATPSVSVTLSGLSTRTNVTFDDQLSDDDLVLGGAPVTGKPRDRVRALLDEVRALAKVKARARVVTDNDFPTASGLASSASGFAALARAATAALQLDVAPAALSRIARRASASAARSVFGGFVALGTEDDAEAEPLADVSHWAVAIVVAAVTHGEKAIGSTEAMERTRRTSPYYPAWLDDAPKLAAEVRAAILARDLEKLGTAAEASALRMHACALAASPAIVYWTAATLELLAAVRAMRADGLSAWATIDAGPHVKILCAASDAPKIVARVQALCVRTIVASPGEGARIVEAAS
ncbi:MAG: diphosphomevalonate decarboxylase [Polyangiales bacterium]